MVRLKPWIKSLPKPCGIFAANDNIASVVIDVCRELKISIPGDIALVGVDDDPTVCDNTHPSLTSIRPDFRRAGALAVQLLARRIAGGKSAQPERLEYKPVCTTSRLSTRRLSVVGKRVADALDLIRREACSGLKAADVVKAMGVPNVHVVDHVAHPEEFNALLDRAQAEGGLWTIIVRRPCLIAAPKIRQYDEANAAGAPIMPPPEAPCTEAPQGARATGDAAVKSVVIAGLGGQGVIKASDIFADAVFKSGYDVKKAEVHGMSQRGGSVNTDIRFGGSVGSPMVPNGEADILLVMDESQIPNTSHRLAPDGLLLSSKVLENFKYGAPKAATIAMLGVLSAHLDISEGAWHDAIRANLPEKLHEMNIAAFDAGRAWAKLPQGGADNR